MSELSKNLQPIDLKQFVSQVNKNVYKVKGYYSIYITPDGQILDCRYPQDLGHNNFSSHIYEHLDQLPKDLFSSNLRTLEIPFKDVSYNLMDYFNLLDLMYVDTNLYNTVSRVLLSSEDMACQDMGFVKISINNRLKTFEVVIPNAIFERKVTGAQKDVVSKLSEFLNLELYEKLKYEQKNNMQITIKIRTALNSLDKSPN